MNRSVRMINEEGTLSIMAVDTTDMVAEMENIHKTSAVTSAALGRLLTAASMMGAVLKGKDDSLTLRLNGNGPSGTLIAVSDSNGDTRGYVQNPIVEIPLNNKGKLDVKGAVGTEGNLIVMKDLGLKEPYVGQIPIVSGEIAEDITAYFAQSEQIPTVCALGVLVNPNLTIKAAGGFIIQLLPTADDETIEKVEKCIEGIKSVTEMLTEGLNPEEICRTVLPLFNLEVLDDFYPKYKCNCSKERVTKALLTLGKDELLDMANDPDTRVNCHFCNKVYHFSPAEIRKLAK